MDGSVPSEEKLLKLIRKKEKENKDYAGKAEEPTKTSLSETRSVSGGISKRISLINRVLIVVSLGLLGYVFMKWFFVEDKHVKDIKFEKNVSAEEPFAILKQKSDIKPFSHYAEKFKDRDIFDTSFKGNKTPAENLIPVVMDPTRRLKLVGIILDSHPQAIIENVQTKQTFFLSEGDSFEDITVKEIKESKVVLVYQGQSYDMEQ